MPLDFVLADSRSEAYKVSPVLSINDEEHELIVNQALDTSRPMLQRISDYYSDAVYKDDAVRMLNDELNTIKEGDSLIVLKKLKNLCQSAMETARHIYVFCD